MTKTKTKDRSWCDYPNGTVVTHGSGLMLTRVKPGWRAGAALHQTPQADWVEIQLPEPQRVMSDVFNFIVKRIRGEHDGFVIYCDHEGSAICSHEDDAEKYAIHAINCHDQLVETNKELVEALELSRMVLEGMEEEHGGLIHSDQILLKKIRVALTKANGK